MNRKQRARAIVAHHEAAHAVIARCLGVPCLGIFMFPTDESGSAGALTKSAAHDAGERLEQRLDGLRRDGLVALAGPIRSSSCRAIGSKSSQCR